MATKPHSTPGDIVYAGECSDCGHMIECHPPKNESLKERDEDGLWVKCGKCGNTNNWLERASVEV